MTLDKFPVTSEPHSLLMNNTIDLTNGHENQMRQCI